MPVATPAPFRHKMDSSRPSTGGSFRRRCSTRSRDFRLICKSATTAYERDCRCGGPSGVNFNDECEPVSALNHLVLQGSESELSPDGSDRRQPLSPVHALKIEADDFRRYCHTVMLTKLDVQQLFITRSRQLEKTLHDSLEAL
jgi:hypothetical protein